VVNINEKELASERKIHENRSTTHIRIKKTTKFHLDRLMRRYRCKTYNQIIQKLIMNMKGGEGN
jgi:hypothetical protein